ncbi:MAG: hypothetical protein V7668_09215 [Cereibacter changlensis]
MSDTLDHERNSRFVGGNRLLMRVASAAISIRERASRSAPERSGQLSWIGASLRGIAFAIPTSLIRRVGQLPRTPSASPLIRMGQAVSGILLRISSIRESSSEPSMMLQSNSVRFLRFRPDHQAPVAAG